LPGPWPIFKTGKRAANRSTDKQLRRPTSSCPESGVAVDGRHRWFTAGTAGQN